MKKNMVSILVVLSITACSPAGDSGGDSSSGGTTKPPPQNTFTPDNNDALPPNNNPTGSLTGEAKCWNKMLSTPEYTACKGANKIYNRIKKTCVELGMTRSDDCSGIEASQIEAAKNDMLTKLPKAFLTVDQCGYYMMNGKKYYFAYLLGQRFFEDKNPENQPVGYKIHVKSICYRPATGNTAADEAICKNDALRVSDPAPVMPGSLGTCD